jgi:hypothetical protein
MAFVLFVNTSIQLGYLLRLSICPSIVEVGLKIITRCFFNARFIGEQRCLGMVMLLFMRFFLALALLEDSGAICFQFFKTQSELTRTRSNQSG